MDQDLLLALYLQEEEEVVVAARSAIGSLSPALHTADIAATPDKVLSVVDPSWELLDPSPDIRGLFLQFNQLFFWGKLAGVEVKWSPRMTLCAGVCSYEGRGGLCSIRLSEPLLKLRPRKDLVETLLHEMIHALLFVTHNNRDHNAHGDEFCKHMRRINGITGAKISVYHNFNDEVDEYRKHWWLCNGPCQKRRPFFGYVKRAMNRPPSANDPWWAEHKQTCGGTFTKIKEPENYSKKGNGKRSLSSSQNVQLPTAQNAKLSDDKGKQHGVDIRTIIPFTGRGYKLGEQSMVSPWANVRSPGNILKSTIESTNTNAENPVKLLQNSSSIPNHRLYNSVEVDDKELIVVKKKKISVANTKAFKNINGSPVRILPVFGSVKISNPLSTKNTQCASSPRKDTQSASSNIKDTQSTSNTAKRWISFEVSETLSSSPSSSKGSSSNHVFPVFGRIKGSGASKDRQSFPSTSTSQKRISNHDTSFILPSEFQGSRNSDIGGKPHKRPKIDNRDAIVDFFAVPSNAGSSGCENTCATSSHGNSSTDITVSYVQASSTSSQSAKVSCPICHTPVLESKINEHLDCCLTTSFLREEPVL